MWHQEHHVCRSFLPQRCLTPPIARSTPSRETQPSSGCLPLGKPHIPACGHTRTRPSRRCFELPGSSGRAHTSHLFRPTTHAHTPVLTHRTTQTDHTPTSHPSTPEFIANVHGQRKRRTNKREARRVRALTSRLLWHAHLGTPTRLICSIPNSFMHATLS